MSDSTKDIIRFVDRYKDPVRDNELLAMIEQGVMSSVGDFLNSSDLARERQKATYEYGMIPQFHLTPQGVSQIVSSDTVEAVEGYTAILAELMFNNNRIARFIPAGSTPTDFHQAKVASDLVNYAIFKQNPGWEILNTWVKSALLWKNSIVRWEFIEDFDYSFEEYDSIDQENLDIILADADIEIIGNLKYDQELRTDEEGNAVYAMVYKDVRLKRKVNKTRILIKNVHPECFRITRDAHSLDDAAFVGIQIDMTRSEVRKFFPDIAETIDWDAIGDGSYDWATKYTEEQAARKRLVGEEYWLGGNSRELFPSEANRQITVIECWLRVDRDGDGIAELKHFIIAGSTILLEEDCESIPLATLCPFEVPHEFFGLSVADMVRPATMATTAIMRGFVENVYLTNYSPKLADPNVVDFSALQNMKPKQIIATNGNPQTAVSALTPDTISTGTVPLLELLQVHKEQATGMGKAAQGLNDTLFVSGNSEEKMARAMSAAQVRIQFMARRFAETGFKRLTEGVYKTMRTKLRGKVTKYYDQNNLFKQVDPGTLPDNMMLYIDVDVGENSNSNVMKKMNQIGTQLIPALQQAGAGGAINPEAAVHIACKSLEAMDLDPLDYLVDYTKPEFKEQAQKSRDAEIQAQEKQKQLQEQATMLDLAQRQATLDLTNIQSKNAMQDNVKQLMVALDVSYQKWADIAIKAAKEGVELPKQPNIKDLLAIAKEAISSDIVNDASRPKGGAPMPEVQGPAAAGDQPQM
jgi:hypothetical protein